MSGDGPGGGRAFLEAVLDANADAVVVVDEDLSVRWASGSVRHVWGWAPDELVGTGPVELIHPEDLPSVLEGLAAVVAGELPDGFREQCRLRRRDGEWRSAEVAGRDARNRPEVGGIVVSIRDITERTAHEASLQRAATHDDLTGLPNRPLLIERIGRALEGLRHSGGRHSVALLFVDLDHFESVNDILGHELGDRILVDAAHRISEVVRPGDTVARFGGDEFVVLCERLDDPEDALVIAHRIDTALSEPVDVDGRQVHLGVSIGVSFADAEDRDPAAILREADTAMYRAKSDGRGRWVVFDDELRRAATERRRLETELRDAAEGRGLELHHQPMVDLATGAVVGFEALLRWRHGAELVPPDVFVPLAEASGLIVPIGAWALRTAAEHGARWQRLAGREDLEIAVNVSARQLQHPGFVDVVAEVVRTSGLTPGTLSLEITESILLDDIGSARDRLDALKDLGVRLALDDFGTGYSSLTYLRRFPVDTVKLDQSFVSDMDRSARDAAIVEAVIDLATALGKRCVAEGIENDEQITRLRSLGCELGQGYHFSAPLVADDVPGLLGGAAR